MVCPLQIRCGIGYSYFSQLFISYIGVDGMFDTAGLSLLMGGYFSGPSLGDVVGLNC